MRQIKFRGKVLHRKSHQKKRMGIWDAYDIPRWQDSHTLAVF